MIKINYRIFTVFTKITHQSNAQICTKINQNREKSRKLIYDDFKHIYAEENTELVQCCRKIATYHYRPQCLVVPVTSNQPTQENTAYKVKDNL